MKAKTIKNEGFKYKKGDFPLTYYTNMNGKEVIRFDYDESKWKLFKLNNFLEYMKNLDTDFKVQK